MREILFRGKRKDINKWIEGWYVPPVDYKKNHWDASISYKVESGHLEDVEVIPETVGQYTGLRDKNGKKIFEGDIVKAFKHNEEQFICAIKYKNGCFWFGNWNWCEFLNKFRSLEFIGNIHDNPELLVIEE